MEQMMGRLRDTKWGPEAVIHNNQAKTDANQAKTDANLRK
jgi:hypothetical protein